MVSAVYGCVAVSVSVTCLHLFMNQSDWHNSPWTLLYQQYKQENYQNFAGHPQLINSCENRRLQAAWCVPKVEAWWVIFPLMCFTCRPRYLYKTSSCDLNVVAKNIVPAHTSQGLSRPNSLKLKDPAQHTLRHKSRLITVTAPRFFIMRTSRAHRQNQRERERTRTGFDRLESVNTSQLCCVSVTTENCYFNVNQP